MGLRRMWPSFATKNCRARTALSVVFCFLERSPESQEWTIDNNAQFRSIDSERMQLPEHRKVRYK